MVPNPSPVRQSDDACPMEGVVEAGKDRTEMEERCQCSQVFSPSPVLQ